MANGARTNLPRNQHSYYGHKDLLQLPPGVIMVALKTKIEVKETVEQLARQQLSGRDENE